MANLVGDLRNPYNLAGDKAFKIITAPNGGSEAEWRKALYSVYCEALHAVSKAIRNGAGTGDLERAIGEIGASKHRIVKE